MHALETLAEDAPLFSLKKKQREILSLMREM
jgi:hypothetical protein